MKNIKIQIYIRPMTNDLLAKYCEIYQLDKSRAIDELLYGRLQYLEEARNKAKKQAEKQKQEEFNKDPMKAMYGVSE